MLDLRGSMAKKIITKKFDLVVPIYDVIAQIVFTNDVHGYIKKVGEWSEWLESGDAVTWEAPESDPYVAYCILPLNVLLGRTVHECVHIADIIAARAGILPTEEEDEAFAYLVEFIHTEMMKFKKKANKYY